MHSAWRRGRWILWMLASSAVGAAPSASPPAPRSVASLPGMESKERTLCKDNYEAYEKRLAKDPNDDAAWKDFRACTTELKRWTDAADVAFDALQKNPNQPQAHLLLGIAHLHSKEYDQAADHFHTAARLKPDDAVPYYYL